MREKKKWRSKLEAERERALGVLRGDCLFWDWGVFLFLI